MNQAIKGTAIHGFTAEITFTCNYCQRTMTGSWCFPTGMDFIVPLPEGWDAHHGRPVCERHQVLVYTQDEREGMQDSIRGITRYGEHRFRDGRCIEPGCMANGKMVLGDVLDAACPMGQGQGAGVE